MYSFTKHAIHGKDEKYKIRKEPNVDQCFFFYKYPNYFKF